MSAQSFVEELRERGLIYQMTPAFEEYIRRHDTFSAYIGYDPSGPSLHLGNLATIMLLKFAEKHGNTPIAVLGGATGMIGDPSGKSAERNLLDVATLWVNEEKIGIQLRKLMPNCLVVNNYDWMREFSYLDFLRDVGKHLSINYMMAKDSVKNRLETGISYTEFSYQLLQAYDFYYLRKHYNCVLQMGGSDQWGNITSGIELISRLSENTLDAYALTTPLLVKPDGTKYGKSESGAIWLDATLTSPFRLYQFIINTEDQMLPRLLNLFSLRPVAEIRELIAAHEANPGARLAHKALAEDLVSWIHGPEALTKAQESTAMLFGETPIEKLRTLSESDLLEVFEGVTHRTLPRTIFAKNPNIVTILGSSGIFSSNGEAKKAIQNKAVRINTIRVENIQRSLTEADILCEKFILIQNGKKNWYLLELTN